MGDNRVTRGGVIWLAWIIVNLGGILLAALLLKFLFSNPLSSNLYEGIKSIANQPLRIALIFVYGAAGWFAIGVVTGTCQLIVLRSILPKLLQWLVVTGAAFAVAGAINGIANISILDSSEGAASGSRLISMMLGGLFGTIIGTGQWLAIKKVAPYGGLWIAASSFGWFIGSYRGYPVYAMVVAALFTGFVLTLMYLRVTESPDVLNEGGGGRDKDK